MVLPKDVSLNEIEKLLEKYLRYATITKNEDKVLNSQGLRSKMPNEFYEVGHALYEDVFARYKIIGLTLYKKIRNIKSSLWNPRLDCFFCDFTNLLATHPLLF
ncbi:MAG: hypothetical protein QM478_06245 [Flavobacteriaceae bacterium]